MSRGLRTPALDAPPLHRYGFPDVEPRTSPAAATDFSETITGPYIERLLTVWCRLVTASDAGARAVVVQFLDGNGNVYRTCGAAATTPESTTIDYSFSVFQPLTEFPVDSTILVPLDPLLLQPSLKWKLHIVGAQTTDQLSRIRVSRERFYSSSPIPGRADATDG